jgi:hypothetical protein
MYEDEFEETLAVDEADTLYGRRHSSSAATMSRYVPEPDYAADIAKMEAEAAAMKKYVEEEIAWQEKEMMRDFIDRPKEEEKLKRAVGKAKSKARVMTRRTEGLQRKLESIQSQIKKIERGM